MWVDRKLCDGLPSALSLLLDPNIVHYDVPQCGVVLYQTLVWFCTVYWSIVWHGPLLAFVGQLATQLSLNYQIIPHIPRDHTGHLSRQADS